MIKKKFQITIIMFLFSGTINIPFLNTASKAEAGIIKWGVKKVIFGSLKIIFSEAKGMVVDKAKLKLLNYLKNNPEYIDYTANTIKSYIQKYPRYSDRGIDLINKLSILSKEKIYQ